MATAYRRLPEQRNCDLLRGDGCWVLSCAICWFHRVLPFELRDWRSLPATWSATARVGEDNVRPGDRAAVWACPSNQKIFLFTSLSSSFLTEAGTYKTKNDGKKELQWISKAYIHSSAQWTHFTKVSSHWSSDLDSCHFLLYSMERLCAHVVVRHKPRHLIH